MCDDVPERKKLSYHRVCVSEHMPRQQVRGTDKFTLTLVINCMELCASGFRLSGRGISLHQIYAESVELLGAQSSINCTCQSAARALVTLVKQACPEHCSAG